MSQSVGRLFRRLVSEPEPIRPWTRLDAAYLAAVRRATRRQLLSGGRGPRSLKASLYRLARRICGTAGGGAASKGWTIACLVLGLSASSEAEDRSVVKALCDSLVDESGDLATPPQNVEDCMIGYSMLSVSQTDSEAGYRRACDRIVRFLTAEHPMSPSGTLPYSASQPVVMLVDSLAMVCPFLSRYGRLFDSEEAMDLAVRQVREFMQRGMEESTGLPFHGYRVDEPGHLGVAGWARGAGWFAMGLADTLSYLPREHDSFGEIADALRAFAGAARKHQTAEGYFRWIINLPGARVDSSGTAMIGYAILRGIETGVLAEDFLPVASEAAMAIVRSTGSDGTVYDAMGESGGVGIYPLEFGAAPWAQGPAAALGIMLSAYEKARRAGTAASHPYADRSR